MVTNNNNTHSLLDITKAAIQMLPRMPNFLRGVWQLSRPKKTDFGSTAGLLQQQAMRNPHALFLHYHQQRYSYGEFNTWCNRLARRLQAEGIKKGDCVAVMMGNCPQLLACVFAINKLGAVAGMMNPKQRGAVLEHSFGIIQPKLLIYTADCQEALDSCTLNAAITAFEYPQLHVQSTDLDDSNLAVTDSIQLGDICYYVFTSGTTGMPKSAALTHLRWVKAGIAFGSMSMALKPSDVQYCAMPLYHNTALSVSLSTAIRSGSSVVLADKFSASSFWDDIRRYQCTCFIYVGEICRFLLNQPEQATDRDHKVRVILGNGLRAEIWDAFQQRFGIKRICELYGASEGNVGFVNAFNLKRTVGFSPMKYAIVQFDIEREQPLVNPQGHMQRVNKGDIGLLITAVTDKAPFDGYTNNPNANSAKLMHNVFAQGDCWFNTGDLVRDQGYRHIGFIDRVGDTFRWKAENVATTEVEAQIQTFADVVEAVVYGVEVPNTDGRAGMASLILAHGRRFNPSAFYQHLKRQLPDYAVPLFVRLGQQHEVTGTFKIMKSELKKQGFRLRHEQEKIYVLIDRTLGYQPLDADLLQQIESGSVRF
ncbi:long-chain-acyl-CoA synthetase [Pseudidiomarina mangrovi]|uniref:long-chain-acyl-CoA synthetase n=1 Tax=Pseudidiomarina mangrovi TaxID=2487133 RepID=UPI000FCC3050|nr:long-chain-acyl-CoA synthetase [Pseudidiomarina mangrovi]